MSVLKKLLSSRKFVVMLVGMIAAVSARLGLPEEAADQVAITIVVLAGTYGTGKSHLLEAIGRATVAERLPSGCSV